MFLDPFRWYVLDFCHEPNNDSEGDSDWNCNEADFHVVAWNMLLIEYGKSGDFVVLVLF